MDSLLQDDSSISEIEQDKLGTNIATRSLLTNPVIITGTSRISCFVLSVNIRRRFMVLRLPKGVVVMGWGWWGFGIGLGEWGKEAWWACDEMG